MQEKSSFAAGFVFRRKGQGESNKAKGIDFKGIENDILIEIRLKKDNRKCNLIPFSFHLIPIWNRLYFKKCYKK